jgi:hypothetical protein
MQRVELISIFAIALAVLATISIARSRVGDHGNPYLQIFSGLLVGGVAAFIVLVLNVDLVPDDLEAAAGPWVVVLITLGIATGTVIRLARR